MPIDSDSLHRAIFECSLFLILGFAGIVLFRKRSDWRWLIAGLAIHFAYLFVVSRGFGAVANWPQAAQWNWIGKGASLAMVLAIAALPVFGWKAAGISLKQNRGSLWAWIPLLVAVAVAAYFAWSGGDGKPSPAETIAFQWTMPSLDEEVYYRGLLLLVLDQAFRARANILGAPIGWGGLLSIFLFGSIHGFQVDGSNLQVDAIYFAWTAALGAFFLWLRARTGSILAPVVGHSAGNGLFTLF